ncbi:MAG TPA: SRPBCC family protein [Thermoanaerobaculia bacterium]|nr:SRPBCC family protein [Thermoanaerobaculia bacterium]
MRPATLLLVLAFAAGSVPGDRRETPTGDVWVEMVSAGKDLPREGVGRGEIEAPPERVYRALVDVAHWEEFVPFMDKSDARPQPDGAILSAQLLTLPRLLGRRHYEVRVRHRVEKAPAGRVWHVDWTYVPGSGNVAGHHGSWTLTALPGGKTWAVCRLFTDPGGAMPHWSVDRGTSATVPWIFHGLRQHIRRSRYDSP